MKDKWIQKIKFKKGTLSKQLGVPIEEKIPKTLLRKIIKAEPGDLIKNPTKIGKRKLKVTKLMEQRSNLALNLKMISEKRKR
jgi:hypothetical protein